MQQGSLVRPKEDYATIFRENNIKYTGIIPNPSTICVCEGIIRVSQYDCLRIEECKMDDFWEFDPKYWVEVQPPISKQEIEELIEECTCVPV